MPELFFIITFSLLLLPDSLQHSPGSFSGWLSSERTCLLITLSTSDKITIIDGPFMNIYIHSEINTKDHIVSSDAYNY